MAKRKAKPPRGWEDAPRGRLRLKAEAALPSLTVIELMLAEAKHMQSRSLEIYYVSRSKRVLVQYHYYRHAVDYIGWMKRRAMMAFDREKVHMHFRTVITDLTRGNDDSGMASGNIGANG